MSQADQALALVSVQSDGNILLIDFPLQGPLHGSLSPNFQLSVGRSGIGLIPTATSLLHEICTVLGPYVQHIKQITGDRFTLRVVFRQSKGLKELLRQAINSILCGLVAVCRAVGARLSYNSPAPESLLA